jgi:hypothetical protein
MLERNMRARRWVLLRHVAMEYQTTFHWLCYAQLPFISLMPYST